MTTQQERRLGIYPRRKRHNNTARTAPKPQVQKQRAYQPAHERRLGITIASKRNKLKRPNPYNKPLVFTYFMSRETAQIFVIDEATNTTAFIGQESTAVSTDNHPIGEGLFAAKTYHDHTLIGRFVGTLMHPEERLQSNSDAIIKLKIRGVNVLVDGKGPLQTDAEQIAKFGKVLIPYERFHRHMCACLINDPKDIPGKRANVHVSDAGWLWTECCVKKGTELFMDYGDEYWPN